MHTYTFSAATRRFPCAARFMLLCGISACGAPPNADAPRSASRPTNESAAPVVRAFASDSLWQRVWMAGSDSTDDTFVDPRFITVTGDLVVVLDPGTREVRAFAARTGAPRFVITARGEGPGEFKRPARLTGTPTGFAVLDHATARLTAFDRTGRYEWSAVLNNVFSIDGLCVRAGPRIVARHRKRDSSIVEYDNTGQQLAVRTFPMKSAPVAGGDFGFAGTMSDASASGECVVAPTFGAEFGIVAPSGEPRVFALKEPGPAPVITTGERTLSRSDSQVVVARPQASETPAASHLALILGDTAIVYAANTRQSPLRLLDYYRTSTGEYLYSRKLPEIFGSLTIGPDGTFYGGVVAPNAQVLVAIRPVAAPRAPSSKPH